MTDKFAVGDMAVIIGGVAQLNGLEVEIIEGLQYREWFIVGTRIPREGMAYLVRFQDGREMSIRPKYLRKKRPPREPTVAWESVPYFSQITRPQIA